MLARAPACGSPSSPTTTTRCLAASPSTSTDRRASSPARGHEVTVVTGHLLHTPPIADQDARPDADEGFEVVRAGRRRAALRQRLADDPHRPGRARAAAAPPLQAPRRRRRAPARALQPEHVRDRAARDPAARDRRRHLPLGLRARRAARRLRARSCGAGSAGSTRKSSSPRRASARSRRTSRSTTGSSRTASTTATSRPTPSRCPSCARAASR